MKDPIIILVCERCGVEERSDRIKHWSRAHGNVSWSVPEDGINGTTFHGVLCVSCRGLVSQVIRNAMKFNKDKR